VEVLRPESPHYFHISRYRPLGTEDFLGICENVASKSLTLGFENAPALYRTIARITTLNDFKQTVRAGLAPMEVLTTPGENGEVRSALSSAVRSYIQGSRFCGTYVISYEALLADELDALTRPFYEAGFLTAATVDATLITMLTSNAGTGPVLTNDGVVLFHSSHSNYTATSGAPSVSTLSVGRQAMRRQKDAGTTRCLNIQPKYLLVPPALESEARVLCAAEYVAGRDDNLECVVSPQLEDGTDGATAWYLLADPRIHDTLDVGFIGGEAPELSSQKGWEIDGTATRIGIGVGVCALDYRGMYRKKGA
jgi:phage major head subunit gpT-like protein